VPLLCGQEIRPHISRLDAIERAYSDPHEGGTATLIYGDEDPFEIVVSANIHRRHLTAVQKREIIAELLKANPERSNRATARVARVSDNTVGAVRASLEAGAQIAHQEKRLGLDGILQPAHKPSADVVQLLGTNQQTIQRRTVDATEARASDKRVDAFIRGAVLGCICPLTGSSPSDRETVRAHAGATAVRRKFAIQRYGS